MNHWKNFQGLKLVDFLKSKNLYPFFRAIEKTDGETVELNSERLVMLSSNNYLGLTHHPTVVAKTQEAVKLWGTGCTGSRFLNGNLTLHQQLEDKLAEFLGYESCLVFATGFMANQGAISALAQQGDYILSDSHNHACIIEGCKLSKATIISYEHNDPKDLEEKISKLPEGSHKMIITDGVFSMTGKIAKLDKISEIAKKYNALFYLDDAHGIGVLGEKGQGCASHYNVMPDILMGTFSKSLASQGGFICADTRTIDWIRMKARTFMFSAALSPASTQAASSALDVLMNEPQRAKQVRDKASFLEKQLNDNGIETMGTQCAIVSIFIGDDKKALEISHKMLKKGFFICPVVYPAVPANKSLIRCSVTVNTTDESLSLFGKEFSAVLKSSKDGETQNLHQLLDQELTDKDLKQI